MMIGTTSVFFYFLLLPIYTIARVNLNLKPKFLSNLLSQDDEEESNSNNKISVDASGRYECLVRGSANESPLSVATQDPALRVGFSYDLKSPGLVNTVFTKMHWRRPFIDWKIGVGPLTGELSTSVQLTRDKAALEIGVSSKHRANFVAQLIPHDRIHLLYNARIAPTPESGPSFAPSKSDWWMPDLQLSTSGRLQSSNFVSYRNRYSVRLLWSRSLGWFGTDDLSTGVQLQLTQRLNRNHITCATLHTTIEDLKETAYMTLSHEQQIMNEL